MPTLAGLSLPSLSPEVLSYFASQGIVSVEDFLIHDVYQLPGLGAVESDILRKGVTEVLSFLETCHTSWRSGCESFNHLEENRRFLPTGCASLDLLLQGGLREGTVTELVGTSSSGKTQLCMQASAHIAYMARATVAYIDTSNSFSSARLEQMLIESFDSQNKPDKTVVFMQTLKSIMCYKAFDAYTMLMLLHDLNSSIEQRTCPNNLRLIVVDSVSAVISPLLGGGTWQGHTLMSSIGQILKRLAVHKGIAVLITNHTVTGEGGHLKPALGESWKSVPHIRLSLQRKTADGILAVSLVKHSSLPCMKEAFFCLTSGGLQPFNHQ